MLKYNVNMKFLNPNIEIRNKFKNPNSNDPNLDLGISADRNV